MELIKIHYTPSKEVKEFREIEQEVATLKKFIVEADKKRQCYAIHHSQVNPHPYNFFVVHARYCLGDDRLFNDRVIINPVIVENVPLVRPGWDEVNDPKWDEKTRETMYSRWQKMPAVLVSQLEQEGCMSFPFRKPKKVDRFVSVKVSYVNEKFEPVTTTLDGPAGHIFQHEVDHGLGKNIYFTR